jgi:transcriptional regulator with XRE-family HTH domain
MTLGGLNRSDGLNEESLGSHLRSARRAAGLTLRAVEEATQKAVTNGYLSQIENGTTTRPSPNVLFHLAEVYKLDYGDLLARAGHRVPHNQAPTAGAVAGLPLRALEGLTEEEQGKLLEYIAFLRSTRSSGGGTLR